MAIQAAYEWVELLAAELSDLGAEKMTPTCAAPWVSVPVGEGDDLIEVYCFDGEFQVWHQKVGPGPDETHHTQIHDGLYEDRLSGVVRKAHAEALQ